MAWTRPGFRGPSAALVGSAILATLASCATTTPSSVARNAWHEVRGEHFRLWTEGDASEGDQLLVELERVRRVLVANDIIHDDADAAASPMIFVTRNSRAFAALTRRRPRPMHLTSLGDAGSKVVPGVARMVSMRGSYLFVNSGAAAEARIGDAKREWLLTAYAADVRSSQNARVPRWYASAASAFISNIEVGPDGSYTWGCLAPSTLEFWSRCGWAPLRRVMDESWKASDEERLTFSFPMQSWFLLHFFTSDPVHRAQLERYLELWREGKPYDELVRAAFSMTPEQLDRAVEAHRHLTSTCSKVTPSVRSAAVQRTSRPLAQSEVDQQLGQLELELFGPTDEAARLLRRAAAAKPADPATLASLTRFELARACSNEDADSDSALVRGAEYLQQLQHAKPDDAETVLLAGDVHRVRGARVRASDPARARSESLQARDAYRAVIRKEQRRAEAWLGLGLSYLTFDDGAKEAEVALEVANVLRPFREEGPIALARLFERRSRLAQAIATLEEARRRIKSPPALQNIDGRARTAARRRRPRTDDGGSSASRLAERRSGVPGSRRLVSVAGRRWLSLLLILSPQQFLHEGQRHDERRSDSMLA